MVHGVYDITALSGSLLKGGAASRNCLQDPPHHLIQPHILSFCCQYLPLSVQHSDPTAVAARGRGHTPADFGGLQFQHHPGFNLKGIIIYRINEYHLRSCYDSVLHVVLLVDNIVPGMVHIIQFFQEWLPFFLRQPQLARQKNILGIPPLGRKTHISIFVEDIRLCYVRIGCILLAQHVHHLNLVLGIPASGYHRAAEADSVPGLHKAAVHGYQIIAQALQNIFIVPENLPGQIAVHNNLQTNRKHHHRHQKKRGKTQQIFMKNSPAQIRPSPLHVVLHMPSLHYILFFHDWKGDK